MVKEIKLQKNNILIQISTSCCITNINKLLSNYVLKNFLGARSVKIRHNYFHKANLKRKCMSPQYFELEVETSFSLFSLIFETPSLVTQNVVCKTAVLYFNRRRLADKSTH